MTVPICNFSKTPSSLTKDNLPLSLCENTFLTYTMAFFQELQDINMPLYYYSTSATINADFKQFCSTHKLTPLFTSGELEIHLIGMSIRDKIQFLYPSDAAQIETERMKGTGFCLSRQQLRYVVALTKVVTRDIIQASQNNLLG